MKKSDRAWLRTGLIILDAAAVAFAMAVAYQFRVSGAYLTYHSSNDTTPYLHLAIVGLPVWIIAFALTGLYSPNITFGSITQYTEVFRASTYAVVGLVLVAYLERRDIVSRGWLILTWALAVFLTISGRMLCQSILVFLRRRGLFRSRLLIVGASARGIAIARRLASDPGAGQDIAGFIDDYLPYGSAIFGGLIVLGHPAELERVLETHAINEILVLPDALTWESYQDVIRGIGLMRPEIRMTLSPGVYETLTTGISIRDRAGVPLLELNGMRISGGAAIVRAVFDYTGAFIILMLAFPLMLCIALALRCIGEKRVFDRYRVLGFRGREFEAIKFHTGLLGVSRRSLAVRSSRQPVATTNLDSLRLWLYRTGMDKLPQLFSVLTGNMSLVGPRLISSRDALERWVPNLMTIKPGLTGPWALANHYDVDEEVRDTLHYIQSWHPALDLSILVRTIKSAISRPAPEVLGLSHQDRDRREAARARAAGQHG